MKINIHASQLNVYVLPGRRGVYCFLVELFFLYGALFGYSTMRSQHTRRRQSVLEHNALRVEANLLVISRNCLCEASNRCCRTIDGMCKEKRVLLYRSERNKAGAFKSSMPPYMLIDSERDRPFIELLPIIHEER